MIKKTTLLTTWIEDVDSQKQYKVYNYRWFPNIDLHGPTKSQIDDAIALLHDIECGTVYSYNILHKEVALDNSKTYTFYKIPYRVTSRLDWRNSDTVYDPDIIKNKIEDHENDIIQWEKKKYIRTKLHKGFIFDTLEYLDPPLVDSYVASDIKYATETVTTLKHLLENPTIITLNDIQHEWYLDVYFYERGVV